MICRSLTPLQHGKITDPPTRAVSSSTSGVRFARSEVQSGSSLNGPVANSSSDIFCNTCQTNQYFLTQNLKEVDAVSRSEDPAKWRRQQEHIKSLEKRYPQVCDQCRPKARERIRHSNVLSRRSNMLASLLKTTRGEYSPISRGRLWRSALFKFGLFGRVISVLIQTAWHILGARASSSGKQMYYVEADQPANPRHLGATFISCATQTFAASSVNASCFVNMSTPAGYALLLGIATIWWNNKLHTRYLDRKPGRLVGTIEYYMLQVSSLSIRFGAWLLLQNPSQFAFLASSMKPNTHTLVHGIHYFMILLIVILELKSRSAIWLNNTYQVNTVQRDEDILPPDTPRGNPIGENEFHRVQSSASPAWMSKKTPHQFSVSDLSISSKLKNKSVAANSPVHPVSHSLTPQRSAVTPQAQASDNGIEPMDWSPIQSTPRQLPSTISHHNLRSRQPPNQSAKVAPILNSATPRTPFRAGASSSIRRQDNDFSDISSAVGQEDDVYDAASVLRERRHSKPADIAMAQPRWFLAQDQVETGLESIMDKAFTLDDLGETPRSDHQRPVTPPLTGHEAMFGSQFAEPVQTGRNASNIPGNAMRRSFLIGAIVVCGALAILTGWPMRFWTG